MKLLTFFCLAAGVFGDSLFHINKHGDLFQSKAGPVDDPGWAKINGRKTRRDRYPYGKTDIGCNVYNKCWAVNGTGDIFYADLWNAWNSDQPISWEMASWKPFKAVSTADDGSVWVIDKDNTVYRATRSDGPWKFVSHGGVDVAAVNYEDAWIAGEDGGLYHLRADFFGPAEKVKLSYNVGLTRVARCNNGEVYVVGNHGKLWYKTGDVSWGLKSFPGVEAFDVACKNNRVYHIGRWETLHVMDDGPKWNEWTRVQGVRAVRIG